MEIFLFILSAVLIIVGIIGAVVPALPGPPLGYVGSCGEILVFVSLYIITISGLSNGVGKMFGRCLWLVSR